MSPRLAAMLFVLALTAGVPAMTPAGAQSAQASPAQGLSGAPQERCLFDGYDPTTSTLAQSMRTTQSWVLCPPGGNCRPSTLRRGEPVVVYRVEGDWTCTKVPGGPAWVASKDLQHITVNPAPPLGAWLGTWQTESGRVTIRRGAPPNTLALVGNGRWEGARGVVHTGAFRAQTAPDGNRLHIVERSCEISVALIGSYILADDNNACGGVNVRFWGIWRRPMTPASR